MARDDNRRGLPLRRALVWAGAAALLAVVAAPARAQSTPPDLLREAERAERALRFEAAEQAYGRIVEVAPGSREARRARVRLDWLADHRDETLGFEPLVGLSRARRTQTTGDALLSFASKVEHMPEGRVRRESLFLLGQGWHRRLAEPARAVPFYESLLQSPGLSVEERPVAEVALAEARVALGRDTEALDGLEAAGLAESFEGRALRTTVRRSRLRLGAAALLVATLLALIIVARPASVSRDGLRAALAPRGALPVLYVVLVPAALAELYRGGMAEVFLWFGALALPVLALTVVGARSMAERGAGRWRVRATLASVAAAHLALAVLALDAAGGLASFGF